MVGRADLHVTDAEGARQSEVQKLEWRSRKDAASESKSTTYLWIGWFGTTFVPSLDVDSVSAAMPPLPGRW